MDFLSMMGHFLGLMFTCSLVGRSRLISVEDEPNLSRCHQPFVL